MGRHARRWSTPRKARDGALIMAAGVVLGACGGKHSGGVAHRSEGASGRAVFADACRSCHTLGGRQATQGGDLRGLTIGRRAMLQFVREMPVRPRLSNAQVAAVADYVRSVQRAQR